MRAMRIAYGMSLLAERKTKKTSGLGTTCVRQSIGQVHIRKRRSRPALWQTYVKGAFPTSRGHWGYCTTGDTLPHTLKGEMKSFLDFKTNLNSLGKGNSRSWVLSQVCCHRPTVCREAVAHGQLSILLTDCLDSKTGFLQGSHDLAQSAQKKHVCRDNPSPKTMSCGKQAFQERQTVELHVAPMAATTSRFSSPSQGHSLLFSLADPQLPAGGRLPLTAC